EAGQVLVQDDGHVVVGGERPPQGREAEGMCQGVTDHSRRVRQRHRRRLAADLHALAVRGIYLQALAAKFDSDPHDESNPGKRGFGVETRARTDKSGLIYRFALGSQLGSRAQPAPYCLGGGSKTILPSKRGTSSTRAGWCHRATSPTAPA